MGGTKKSGLGRWSRWSTALVAALSLPALSLPALSLPALSLPSLSVSAQGSWVRVSPAELGFTVEFPGRPQARSSGRSDAQGMWANHSLQWGTEGGPSLQVTVKDYAQYDIRGVPIDAVLESTCRDLASTLGVTLEGTEPVQQPLPGRRCRFAQGATGASATVYWSAPRLYLLVSACPRARCAGERERQQRFFSSFRVLPAGDASRGGSTSE